MIVASWVSILRKVFSGVLHGQSLIQGFNRFRRALYGHFGAILVAIGSFLGAWTQVRFSSPHAIRRAKTGKRPGAHSW